MKNLLTFLLLALVLSSCSDESSEDSGDFKPEITTLNLTAKVPTSLQSKSPVTWEQISTMEAYMNMGGMFMNQSNTKKTAKSLTSKLSLSASNYNWSVGDYVVDYSYKLMGEKYEYTYVITLKGDSYATINGWQNTNGTAGHWTYDINLSVVGVPSTSNFNIDFDWTKNNAGNYNFDMVFNMGDYGTMRYVSNINSDLSGDFNFYIDNELIYASLWNSSGSGRFTDYFTDPPTITTW